MQTCICLYKHVPCYMYLHDTGLLMLNTFFELQMLVGLCYDISCHKLWPVLPFSVLLCPSFLNKWREFHREEDMLPAFQ